MAVPQRPVVPAAGRLAATRPRRLAPYRLALGIAGIKPTMALISILIPHNVKVIDAATLPARRWQRWLRLGSRWRRTDCNAEFRRDRTEIRRALQRGSRSDRIWPPMDCLMTPRRSQTMKPPRRRAPRRRAPTSHQASNAISMPAAPDWRCAQLCRLRHLGLSRLRAPQQGPRLSSRPSWEPPARVGTRAAMNVPEPRFCADQPRPSNREALRGWKWTADAEPVGEWDLRW